MKNAAELIEMPFGMLSGVGPENYVLDGVQTADPRVKTKERQF